MKVKRKRIVLVILGLTFGRAMKVGGNEGMLAMYPLL